VGWHINRQQLFAKCTQNNKNEPESLTRRAANLINNMPMGVLFFSLLAGSGDLTAIYATVIDSNIGAYLTPIGTLAGISALQSQICLPCFWG